MAPSRAFRRRLQAQQSGEFNTFGLVSGSPRPPWWQANRASGQPTVSACGSAPVAAIAQLGERQTEVLKVPGSIPGLGIHLFLRYLSTPFGLRRNVVPPSRLDSSMAEILETCIRAACVSAGTESCGFWFQGAHGVVVSHPRRMREALRSDPVCPFVQGEMAAEGDEAWRHGQRIYACKGPQGAASL